MIRRFKAALLAVLMAVLGLTAVQVVRAAIASAASCYEPPAEHNDKWIGNLNNGANPPTYGGAATITIGGGGNGATLCTGNGNSHVDASIEIDGNNGAYFRVGLNHWASDTANCNHPFYSYFDPNGQGTHYTDVTIQGLTCTQSIRAFIFINSAHKIGWEMIAGSKAVSGITSVLSALPNWSVKDHVIFGADSNEYENNMPGQATQHTTFGAVAYMSSTAEGGGQPFPQVDVCNEIAFQAFDQHPPFWAIGTSSIDYPCDGGDIWTGTYQS